jgi:hypothetical protein
MVWISGDENLWVRVCEIRVWVNLWGKIGGFVLLMG